MTHIDEAGEFTQDDHNNLLKRNAMTVEQMNVVSIEDLDKIKSEYDLMCAYAYGHVYNDFEKYYDRDVLNKCIWFKPLYWSVIMPVWQKLRGELDDLAVDEYGMVKDSDYIVSKYAIEKSILSCDITTAHRHIVEAIQLIKK